MLVLDPSLLKLVPVDQGLQAGRTVDSQLRRAVQTSYGRSSDSRPDLSVVDANHIAQEEIGRVITNTTLLGAMLAAEPMVPVAELEIQLEKRFGRLAQKNINAFRRAQQEAVVVEAV